MAHQLPKLSDMDFEVSYAGSLFSSSSSTGHSGASSPSSCSTSCSAPSSISGHSKKRHLAAAAPEENFLSKKRTMPVSFCPKQKAATSRYQPTKITESKAPKIPYVPRPLQHIAKRRLADPENNENMRAYREFRQLEIQKAQDAKVNGGYEEPSRKKRAQRKRKEF